MGLHASVLSAMIAHARLAAPAECCGVLLGQDGEIVESVPARNIAGDVTRRFEIDPADHIGARKDARQRGLEVVGFYHSHPRSPATPSETDIAEASYPDHLYAIVSLDSEPPEVRFFQLATEGPLAVTLRVRR